MSIGSEDRDGEGLFSSVGEGEGSFGCCESCCRWWETTTSGCGRDRRTAEADGGRSSPNLENPPSEEVVSTLSFESLLLESPPIPNLAPPDGCACLCGADGRRGRSDDSSCSSRTDSSVKELFSQLDWSLLSMAAAAVAAAVAALMGRDEDVVEAEDEMVEALVDAGRTELAWEEEEELSEAPMPPAPSFEVKRTLVAG